MATQPLSSIHAQFLKACEDKLKQIGYIDQWGKELSPELADMRLPKSIFHFRKLLLANISQFLLIYSCHTTIFYIMNTMRMISSFSNTAWLLTAQSILSMSLGRATLPFTQYLMNSMNSSFLI